MLMGTNPCTSQTNPLQLTQNPPYRNDWPIPPQTLFHMTMNVSRCFLGLADMRHFSLLSNQLLIDHMTIKKGFFCNNLRIFGSKHRVLKSFAFDKRKEDTPSTKHPSTYFSVSGPETLGAPLQNLSPPQPVLATPPGWWSPTSWAKRHSQASFLHIQRLAR